MPSSHHPVALSSTIAGRSAVRRRTLASTTLLAATALLTLVPAAAAAQASGAVGSPLHLAASRFEFVAQGDSQAPTKPLRVHNGSTSGFTDVRMTRVTYADSTHGAAWLVATPAQTAVAADELATVSTLCVDPTGLPAGTYHATAGVSAREVPEPVPFTITLVVTHAGASASRAAARCGMAVTK